MSTAAVFVLFPRLGRCDGGVSGSFDRKNAWELGNPSHTVEVEAGMPKLFLGCNDKLTSRTCACVCNPLSLSLCVFVCFGSFWSCYIRDRWLDLAGDGGSTDEWSDTWWELKSPGNVRISQARFLSFVCSATKVTYENEVSPNCVGVYINGTALDPPRHAALDRR